MDIEKIADEILDRDWEYVDVFDNGDFMEQTFSKWGLRSAIIAVLTKELSKGKDASND